VLVVVELGVVELVVLVCEFVFFVVLVLELVV
jgi:hypothetical protein